MRIILPILGILLLAGCASQPQYREVSPDCTCPPEPALPEIDVAEALSCVGDDAYWDLERRDTAIADYVGELEAVCHQLCEAD